MKHNFALERRSRHILIVHTNFAKMLRARKNVRNYVNVTEELYSKAQEQKVQCMNEKGKLKNLREAFQSAFSLKAEFVINPS